MNNNKIHKKFDIKDSFTILAIILCLYFLSLPMPSSIIDIILAGNNIALPIIILLASMFFNNSYKFKYLPNILCYMTLLRICLIVCVSIYILSTSHCENIINYFGNFMLTGNYKIGFVNFILLSIISFIIFCECLKKIYIRLCSLPKSTNTEPEIYANLNKILYLMKVEIITIIPCTAIIIILGSFINIQFMNIDMYTSIKTFVTLGVGAGIVYQISAIIFSIVISSILQKLTDGNKI